MPSVATIESVLRLSAPVQLRVSVPVQLRVSAPVQFRLGPASQRAECREVSVPDWLVDWLPPSAEWSRAENVCAGLAGRLAAAERRVEQSRVDWLSVPVQPFPNRPPRARECLSPISVLSRIGWSIGCHRAQSGGSRECLSPFSPPPNRPPREVSVPDWLVDWLPPSAEWSRECLSLFDLPRSTSRARPPVRPPLPNQPREVSVPDWLVDWLPPNSE